VPNTWRFSIDVARAWEDAAAGARVRTVLMRTAMVMSPDRGGVFDTLLGLARRGLGGRAGHGRQFVSWIHDADFARAVRLLISDDQFSGPVNLSSPAPAPYDDFMRELRGPIGLPATRWMLEAGAFLMRTETELVLKSRRVVPTRLLDAGFEFEFPAWPAAARDLVSRRRSG
jgi:NAD dependent epimerase/dehydratase family enzyme